MKSEFRGRASALQMSGTGIGEAFAMVVLVTIQLRYSLEVTNLVSTSIVLVLAMINLLMIREPRLKPRLADYPARLRESLLAEESE